MKVSKERKSKRIGIKLFRAKKRWRKIRLLTCATKESLRTYKRWLMNEMLGMTAVENTGLRQLTMAILSCMEALKVSGVVLKRNIVIETPIWNSKINKWWEISRRRNKITSKKYLTLCSVTEKSRDQRSLDSTQVLQRKNKDQENSLSKQSLIE